MRHRVKGRKFGRKRGKRRAFLRTLIGNLVISEKIITTEARAKEIRGKIEKLITLAKRRDGIATYRALASRMPKPAALKINKELKDRYRDRQGGYTRIIKTGSKRMRDGSATVLLELVK
jgi:large subunit ribosomal protein L17